MSRPFIVLATGAGGQLGQELSRLRWPRQVRFVALDRRQLDIADAAAVAAAVAEVAPDVVINAAAYTAVDRAEREEAAAAAVNADGPRHLATACARQRAAMLHISTDYVFDGGKAGAYLESDRPAPLSAYGRGKAAGEEAVRRALDRHVILRTSWLFSPHGRNFVKTVLRLAGERQQLRIVADQFGNPTSAADLARAIMRIAQAIVDGTVAAKAPWGTYHVTNAGEASWHELACETLALALGPAAAGRIAAIATADYPTEAARPANSRLHCGKIESVFGIQRRPWREALAPVVAALGPTAARQPREVAH